MFSVGDEAILAYDWAPQHSWNSRLYCLSCWRSGVGSRSLHPPLAPEGDQDRAFGADRLSFIVERLDSRVYVLGGNEAFLVRAGTRG